MKELLAALTNAFKRMSGRQVLFALIILSLIGSVVYLFSDIKDMYLYHQDKKYEKILEDSLRVRMKRFTIRHNYWQEKRRADSLQTKLNLIPDSLLTIN